MKYTILFIIALFWAGIVHADEYLIQFIGGQIIVVEYNGIIHAFGEGNGDNVDNKVIGFYQYDPQENYQEDSNQSQQQVDFEQAQKCEANGEWYAAGLFYKQRGEIEKAKEMGQKDIDQDLARDPPYYEGAAIVAMDLLDDKELAMQYYEKHLDQKKEGIVK